MNDDLALLREYARNSSEAAFTEVVSRHVNLVYSVALRYVREPHAAEEITQAVFIILARKANTLNEKTVLSGWLCRTAYYTSANWLKIQTRRHYREQEAFMQSQLTETSDLTWQQVAPLINSAMENLGRKDHDALVLRFFENKNFMEVGSILGTSEQAARKRVSRALEKLQKFFAKRGIRSTTTMLGETISANSIQAAPIGLAKAVTAIAVVKGTTASISTLTLIKGAMKVMAWTKAKTAIVLGMAVVLATTSTTVIVIKMAQARRPLAERTDVLSLLKENVAMDIRTDGTVLFQSMVEETNASSITTSTDRLDGADQVSWIKDESGKPMKFTRLADGHSFLITLPKPVPPGGTISYSLEGSATGAIKTNAAGEYALELSDSPGNVADMHYVQAWRLPASATLLEKAGGMEATTNAGQIELRSDQVIPPKGTMTISFRYRLPAKTN